MNTLPFDSTISSFAIQQQGLDKASATSEKDDARETAKQFEALLLKTMLKSMRESTPGDGLLNGEQAGLYIDMLDQQIAQDISKSGSFGLQDRIYEQLARQAIKRSTNTGIITHHRQAQSVNAARPIDYFHQSDTGPTAFVNKIRPEARQAARELGTSTEAVIAIAALETGWGKHIPRQDDGSSTHNLFGIKADSQWQGASSSAKTLEYIDGEMLQEQANFRSYKNEQHSIRDFTGFIQQNPRYQSALQVSDNPELFLRKLQDAGYATDPDYAEKAISIMRSIDSPND